MARKFAAIGGLHQVFNTKDIVVPVIDPATKEPVIDPSTGEIVTETRTIYDLTSVKELAQKYVNHNTVCFITADETDADGLYITDHKITTADRFIIVQNDVFSLYGSLETEVYIPPIPDIPENTWRPVYIGGIPAEQADVQYPPFDENADSYTFYDEIVGSITVVRTESEEEGVDYVYKKYIGGNEEDSNIEDFNYAKEKQREQTAIHPVEPFNLNFAKDGSYIKFVPSYEETRVPGENSGEFDTLRTLSIRYDFDMEAALAYIQEHIVIPTPEPEPGGGGGETPEVNIGDAELIVEQGKANVTTSSGSVGLIDVEVKNNTIEVKSTKKEDVEVENPEDPDNPTHTTDEVEGNFTANSFDNTTVHIRYKGTADRVDWYVDQEGRTKNQLETDNDATAKKFVYISPLHEYFQPAGFPGKESILPEKRKFISEDSIVFITCGASTTDGRIVTDEDLFENPEFETGARFIWTRGKLFSSNTWMPLFVRATYSSPLHKVNTIIGGADSAARLIIEGKGGITVTNSEEGANDKIITIDGSNISRGGGSGGVGIITGENGIIVNETADGYSVGANVKPIGSPKVFEGRTEKNFLRIGTNPDNEQEKWLEVPGVDAHSVIIDEPIPISGTLVADHVRASGSFDDCDNIIPVGMSLWEVLHRILYKEHTEIWGNPERQDTFTLTGATNLTVYLADDNGDPVGSPLNTLTTMAIPGTKYVVLITRTGSSVQKTEITGYLGNQYPNCGYQVQYDGEEPRAKVQGVDKYTENMSPTVTNTPGQYSSTFGNLQEKEAGVKYVLTVGETSIETFTANSITSVEKADFVPHKIYPVSDLGNPDTESLKVKYIKPSDFSNPANVNSTKAFTVNVPVENFGTQSVTRNIAIVNDGGNNCKISVPGYGASGYAWIGETLTATLIKNGGGTQSVSIQTYPYASSLSDNGSKSPAAGYKVGTGEIVHGATYTHSFSPIVTPASSRGYKTDETWGFEIADGPENNQLLLTVCPPPAGKSTNQIKIVNDLTVASENFSDFTVYPVSNWGNVKDTGVLVSKNDFNTVTGTNTATFVITPKYPYFIGIERRNPNASISYFDYSSTNSEAEIVRHINASIRDNELVVISNSSLNLDDRTGIIKTNADAPTEETILYGRGVNKFGINEDTDKKGPKQIVFIVPVPTGGNVNNTGWIRVFNDDGDRIDNQGAYSYNHVTIYGKDYWVYSKWEDSTDGLGIIGLTWKIVI